MPGGRRLVRVIRGQGSGVVVEVRNQKSEKRKLKVRNQPTRECLISDF
jgi:hypothetical protein